MKLYTFSLIITFSLIFSIGCGDEGNLVDNPLTTQHAANELDSKSILISVAAAPAANANNPVLADVDPDVFFINGVVDWVSPTGKSVTLSIDVDRLFSDFEDELIIWITSFDNPQLLADIQENQRYTFKVKPAGVDSEISNRRGIIWKYDIWCDLIQVM